MRGCVCVCVREREREREREKKKERENKAVILSVLHVSLVASLFREKASIVSQHQTTVIDEVFLNSDKNQQTNLLSFAKFCLFPCFSSIFEGQISTDTDIFFADETTKTDKVLPFSMVSMEPNGENAGQCLAVCCCSMDWLYFATVSLHGILSILAQENIMHGTWPWDHVVNAPSYYNAFNQSYPGVELINGSLLMTYQVSFYSCRFLWFVDLCLSFQGQYE